MRNFSIHLSVMSQEFTIEQKLALEEHKTLEERIRSSESAFSKWENTYLIANGFVITLLSHLMTTTISGYRLTILSLFLSAFGGALSYQWVRLLGRSLPYILARERRQALIEKYLRINTRKKLHGENELLVFDLKEGTKEFLKNHIDTSWKNRQSTFAIRAQLPLFFFYAWLAILAFFIISFFFR
jgi:hypothetical protein